MDKICKERILGILLAKYLAPCIEISIPDNSKMLFGCNPSSIVLMISTNSAGALFSITSGSSYI